MKTYLYLIALLAVFFTNCDDGDIVVTTFNFDDEDSFDFCSTLSASVFYKESGTNEIITFQLGTVYNNNIAQTREPISVNNGAIVYRRYTSTVSASNLFCQAMAPTGLSIDSELISNRGQAILSTQWVIDPDADDDNDGLTNRQEGIINDNFETNEDLDNLLDTDGDGIPNFRDEDDDNDNVRTIDELARDMDGNLITKKVNGVEEGVFLFTLTKNEMIELPDHLNEDDDADGVKTFNEVNEGSNNPLAKEGNGDLVPAFRLASVSDSNENDELLNQDYRVNTITFLRVENLGLSNGESTTVLQEFIFGSNTLSFINDDFKNIRRSELEVTTTP